MSPRHVIRLAAAAACLLMSIGTPAALAQASDSASMFGSPTRFVPIDGEALYRSICQGCHMQNGQGALGAATYPALARNEKLEASGYPVYIVVNGLRAMPGFGAQLTDDQVASVVNFVRTSFGNAYRDAVTAEHVKAAR